MRLDDLPVRRLDEQHFVASETIPTATVPKALWSLRRFIIGRPIPSEAIQHQRLSKLKALAVFSSDALSSTSYATEEILLVLVLAGAVGLSYLLPIALAIALLLAIVVFSYRQTIHAYPTGGGAYTVTRENLGQTPSLVAASALLIDYVLTVAVSISAGVAAVASAFPSTRQHAVSIGVMAIALITIANLRGIQESGTIFAIPTYAFIATMSILLLLGFANWMGLGIDVHPDTAPVPAATESVTLLLVLRAFASGCAALTGVEAISNGVPAFREPTSRNAARTLVAMALILGILFVGITLLAKHFDIVPSEEETVISQLARSVTGDSPFYYLIQAATASILLVAANTSFADFPRVTSILARDRFLPRQFAFRGDRLVFSVGIVMLAIFASALVVGFGANVSALIGLYAVGVFMSFTLSQAGMVQRWRAMPRSRVRTLGMTISGFGGLTTGIVALVIVETKFLDGAWAVVILIPILIFVLSRIHGHYGRLANELRMPASAIRSRPRQASTRPAAMVPIPGLNRATMRAIDYARVISDDVTVVHITDDLAEAEELRSKWRDAKMNLPLVVVESPYRELIEPLVLFAEQLHREKGGVQLTVVVPEFVPARMWELLLHNQTAWRLRLAFWKHRDIVVTTVTYHLRD